MTADENSHVCASSAVEAMTKNPEAARKTWMSIMAVNGLIVYLLGACMGPSRASM